MLRLLHPSLKMSIATFCRAAVLLCLPVSLSGCAQQTSAKSEKGSVHGFSMAAGFDIELVASEPLLFDPVDLAFDARGRMFVVEMPGYPLDVSASGRIVLLTDTTGDGRPDSRTVFADDLVLPTGIMAWKKGVLVTDAPHVFYLEDVDDDGVADLRRTLLSGFARSNPQHNFNNPEYGLDNWIYVANEGTIWWTKDYAKEFGGRGSEITFAGREGPVLGRNGEDRNIRFKPDHLEIEAMASSSQFGHAFGPWGAYFGGDNSHPTTYEVIPARYLKRNRSTTVSKSSEFISSYGTGGPVYGITENPEHQLLTDRGVFTSASGLTYNSSHLFPQKYKDTIFIAESVHNLVHVDRVVDPGGASFVTEPLLVKEEFLASVDPWFRPVNMRFGPDGALYLLDYHRKIVEHPEWMDDSTNASGQLYVGSDMGRLYRITPSQEPEMSWYGSFDMEAWSDSRLVDSLSSANGWWRQNAQRLLVDRKSPRSARLLENVVRSSDNPLGRLHALWTLEGIGELSDASIEKALEDESAGVRKNGIILAETLPHRELLASHRERLSSDQSSKVRFQLLLSLGSLRGAENDAIRERLLGQNMEDPWFQIAYLSAQSVDLTNLDSMISSLAEQESSGSRDMLERAAHVVGTSADEDQLTSLLKRASGQEPIAWWQAPVLRGIASGVDAKRHTSDWAESGALPLVTTVFESEDLEFQHAAMDILESLGIPPGPEVRQAAAMAETRLASEDLSPAHRSAAVRFLKLDGSLKHLSTLLGTLSPGTPTSVQRSALDALERIDGESVGLKLVERWASLTPAVRSDAIDVFMTNADRMALLLAKVEDGTIRASTVGWNRSVVLMRDMEGPLRDRARDLLAIRPEERLEVIAEYEAATNSGGNVASGKSIFDAICAACHMSGQDGINDFGPNLATVRHWSRHNLLSKILNPSRSLADGYEMWSVVQSNGDQWIGIIEDETEAAITLKTQDGTSRVLERSRIANIEPAGGSMMPLGLEAQISVDEMADLLAYLKSN